MNKFEIQIESSGFLAGIVEGNSHNWFQNRAGKAYKQDSNSHLRTDGNWAMIRKIPSGLLFL